MRRPHTWGMADIPSRRPVGLGADWGDVGFGVGLFAVLLVVAAIVADAGTAVALLVSVVGAFGCLVLVVAVIRRSLRRGVADAARWTFGFVGRWFSFW